MNITIRPGAAADRQQLEQIVRRQTNFLPCEFDTAAEVIAACFDPAEDYRLLVACDAARLAGFIIFGPIPLTENRFDLYWIVVDPSCGRHGIGSRLLRDMEEQLKAAGAGHIYIETSSTAGYLPARLCYEKNGYQLAGRLEDFYRAGDDKLIFRKRY